MKGMVLVLLSLLVLSSVFAQLDVLSTMVAGAGILGMVVAVIMGILSLGLAILYVWMLVDCIKRDFDKKVMWILIILFVPFGAVIYYFMVKRKGSAPKKTESLPTPQQPVQPQAPQTPQQPKQPPAQPPATPQQPVQPEQPQTPQTPQVPKQPQQPPQQ